MTGQRTAPVNFVGNGFGSVLKSSLIGILLFCIFRTKMDGNEKMLKAGIYCFECYPMPWCVYELGRKGDCYVKVLIDLSDENIHDLIEMMNWAWDNEWFEQSTSETVCTQLLKKHLPKLFERVQPLALNQFLREYPNSEGIMDFGVFEIFIPDEILDYAGKSVDKSE